MGEKGTGERREGKFLWYCLECHVHFMVFQDLGGEDRPPKCPNCWGRHTQRKIGRRADDKEYERPCHPYLYCIYCRNVLYQEKKSFKCGKCGFEIDGEVLKECSKGVHGG